MVFLWHFSGISDVSVLGFLDQRLISVVKGSGLSLSKISFDIQALMNATCCPLPTRTQWVPEGRIVRKIIRKICHQIRKNNGIIRVQYHLHNLHILTYSKEVQKSNFRQYGEMKKQSAGRRVRREKIRRKKMQVREKVGKSRNIVFFRGFVAPEGRKVGSLKRRVRRHLGR